MVYPDIVYLWKNIQIMRNYVLAIVLMCVYRCGAAVTNLDVYVSLDGDDRATGAVDNPVAQSKRHCGLCVANAATMQ